MLTLYHWEPIASSALPLILLEEKHLEFDSRYVDVLEFEQLAPEFLALNPQGQVPVLLHAERVLTEATLILEYLETAFPTRPFAPSGLPGEALVPEAVRDRYRMRVWMRYVDEYFAPGVAILGWHTCMAGTRRRRLAAVELARLPVERQAVWRAALEDAYSEAELAGLRASLALRIGRIEQALTTSPWLAGAHYSLADIALFAFVSPLARLLPEALNASLTPRTLEWLARTRTRPAVQRALGRARITRLDETFAPGPEPGRWG
jgi:GSH-dependent disulfide-bond oxidoreductase